MKGQVEPSKYSIHTTYKLQKIVCVECHYTRRSCGCKCCSCVWLCLVLGHINKCVREQKRKCMFDWLLKNDIIEEEINEHPLHAYSSIEEEVESERLCEWCEGEFSLCNTVASKNCIILICSLSLRIRRSCCYKTAQRRTHIACRQICCLQPDLKNLLISLLFWCVFCIIFRSLLQQLQRLQALVSGKVPRSCKIASTQTGTCLMVYIHIYCTNTCIYFNLLVFTHTFLVFLSNKSDS